jgi:hypothetical protein
VAAKTQRFRKDAPLHIGCLLGLQLRLRGLQERLRTLSCSFAGPSNADALRRPARMAADFQVFACQSCKCGCDAEACRTAADFKLAGC